MKDLIKSEQENQALKQRCKGLEDALRAAVGVIKQEKNLHSQYEKFIEGCDMILEVKHNV